MTSDTLIFIIVCFIISIVVIRWAFSIGPMVNNLKSINSILAKQNTLMKENNAILQIALLKQVKNVEIIEKESGKIISVPIKEWIENFTPDEEEFKVVDAF